MNKMTLTEKSLYQQIHPAKLFTDWSTGLTALYFLWQRELVTALVITFVPPIIATLLIVSFADLETYKQSRFGRYVKQYMTRTMEALRFVGAALMALGAWFQIVWLMPLGLLLILFGWLRGVLFPTKL